MKALPLDLIARARKDVADAFENRDEYIIGSCSLRMVQIISRACQLDHSGKKYLVVAPVFEIEQLPEEQRSEGKLQLLRKGDLSYCAYLPATTGLGEAYADLHRMTSIHRSFLPDAEVEKLLVARLTSTGMASLQRHLSTHFGQQFGFDHKDLVPQDGNYACSNCFHSGRPAPHRLFAAGAAFGLCEGCGDKAAFVKMPSLSDDSS